MYGHWLERASNEAIGLGGTSYAGPRPASRPWLLRDRFESPLLLRFSVPTSRRSRRRAGMTTPTPTWWSSLRISSATSQTTCHLRAGCGLNPIFGGLIPNPPMRSGLGVGTRGEGRGTRQDALDSDKWGRWWPLVVVGGADGGPGQRRWGGVGGTACKGRQSRTGPVRLCVSVG